MYNVTIITMWDVINKFTNIDKITFDNTHIKLHSDNDVYKICMKKIKDIRIMESDNYEKN